MLGKEHVMRSIASCVALFAVVCAVAAGSVAAKGGPSPGAIVGWDGIRDPAGGIRYVALPGGAARTTVAVVRTSGGRIVRFNTVPGVVGVPQVAYDGSVDGLSADGRTLVLGSLSRPDDKRTTFQVLQTRNLSVTNTIRLRGQWSFDALSPDGATIYAIEYRTSAGPPSYRVRAIDAATGVVRPGAIVDKRAPGEVMRGSPVTRSALDGTAYTLYARPNGTAFVHALDTRRGTALCLDLPWKATGSGIWGVRLSVAGGVVLLRQPGVGKLASIDLRSLQVRAFRPPKSGS